MNGTYLPSRKYELRASCKIDLKLIFNDCNRLNFWLKIIEIIFRFRNTLSNNKKFQITFIFYNIISGLRNYTTSFSFQMLCNNFCVSRFVKQNPVLLNWWCITREEPIITYLYFAYCFNSSFYLYTIKHFSKCIKYLHNYWKFIYTEACCMKVCCFWVKICQN